mgnify:FL=1
MQALGHFTDGLLIPTQTPTIHLVMTTRLLCLNTAELQETLVAELASNPALELVEERRCPRCHCLLTRLPCPNCHPQTGSADIFEVPRYFSSPSTYPDDDDWRPHDTATVSLAEYVWEQLAPTLTKDEQVIGRYLVDRLDEHGLLPEHPAEIAAYLHRPLQQVQHVLHRLQQTEPVGVGAADVRECLLIQLEHLQALGRGHYPALVMVRDAWDFLARRDLARAAALLDCEIEDVVEALEFINANLYPRPADVKWGGFRHPERGPDRLCEPDVIISVQPGTDRLLVEIVVPSVSWLRVNPIYQKLAREARADANGDGPPQWAILADEADLFIKSLSQRNQTMRLIIDRLVEKQRDFILKGDRYLTPMTRAQLAAEVGVHESTVSRAVSRKTVALPNGRVVELALFFDRALSTRDRVRELIENEQPGAPLSDGQIAAILRAQGVDIARRTVAKYRTALGILPAYLRLDRSTAA